MRFNQETLRSAAKSRLFIKEGKLLHKRGTKEIYKDRWFRLKGNLLFVLPYNNNGVQNDKEPIAMILLESFAIRIEQFTDQCTFTIVFDEDTENDVQYFRASSKQTCNDWVTAIQQASITHLQAKIRSLVAAIEKKTLRDPLSDIVERISGLSKPVSKVSRSPVPVISQRPDNSSKSAPSQGTISAPPPPSTARKPTRKAPLPPKTEKKSTWFDDLQTLDPFFTSANNDKDKNDTQKDLFESDHAFGQTLFDIKDNSKQPENLTQPSFVHPAVNSIKQNTQKSQRSTWYLDDASTSVPSNASKSTSALDPFGMDSTFYTQIPERKNPFDDFLGTQMTDTSKNQNQKWETFD